MILHIAPLTEADARAVCAWRYEGEYAVYNIPDWDIVVSQRWSIADDTTRSREFYSLRNDAEELIGFFRLQEQEGYVLLSLGLAPEYCGMGIGKAAMALILKETERKAAGAGGAHVQHPCDRLLREKRLCSGRIIL